MDKPLRLTFSSITSYNRCPYAYKLRHVDRLYPRDPGGDLDALQFGSLVHEGLARHWLGQPEDADHVAIEPETVRQRCAVAMIAAYNAAYPFDLDAYSTEAVEARFETEKFKGQVDGVIVDKATGERILLEHKTATITGENGLDDYRAKLAMDLQIRLYAHAVGVRKVLYDVLIKPLIRQRKNETVEEFAARYGESCTFERFEIDLSDAEIADAMIDAEATWDAVAAGIFCRHRNACTMGVKCDYFDLCCGRKTADDFDHREPDTELVGELLPEGRPDA